MVSAGKVGKYVHDDGPGIAVLVIFEAPNGSTRDARQGQPAAQARDTLLGSGASAKGGAHAGSSNCAMVSELGRGRATVFRWPMVR